MDTRSQTRPVGPVATLVLILILGIVGGMIVREVRSLLGIKAQQEQTEEPLVVHTADQEPSATPMQPPQLALETPPVRPHQDMPWLGPESEIPTGQEGQQDWPGLEVLLEGLGSLELTEQQQEYVTELLTWIWEQLDEPDRQRFISSLQAIAEDLLAMPSQQRQEVVDQMLERAQQWSEGGGTIEQLLQYLEQQ